MGQLTLFIALLMTWLPTHLPRCFPTLKQSISLSRLACNQLEGGVLEYSRSIKPTKVPVSFYGIQVCSYILPTRHWTWCYITISLFMSIFVTITLHASTYYTLLFTITIVIYLVLSFVLSIDQCPSGTSNYLLTYLYIPSTYYEISIVLFYIVYKWPDGHIGGNDTRRLRDCLMPFLETHSARTLVMG